MEAFGLVWKDYPNKIKEHWQKLISDDDLVLIAGDISWAMRPEEALPDLDFIDALPGQKLLIRGNHDYWWPSSTKLAGLLPPSMHFIHNTAFEWNKVAFAGARLWDTHEYSFNDAIEFVDNPFAKKKTPEELAREKEDAEVIFVRELQRLKLSLEKMNHKAEKKVALTHYPPIGANLRPSRAAALLEDFEIDVCVFGHLHNVREGALPFGTARGVRYILTSADYLGFTPIVVFD